MKAIYTDAAKGELETFQNRQQEMLESIVAEQKLVLGDDVLEITASDIKAASERIQIYRPNFRRIQSTELVTRAYIVIGITMMVGAFFYPQMMEIYASNKTQALIFLMGAGMAALGGIFKYWVQARQSRTLEEVHAFMESMRRQEQDITKSSAQDKSED